MAPPAVNRTVMVEAKNLVKIYTGEGVATTALDGMDMKVYQGEFVAIVGPSGSGKSTLLNMLGALDIPTSGKLFIDGIDITTMDGAKLAELRNRKIGFIFQSFNLISRMNALQNVELPLAIRGVPSDERRRRAIKMLELVGLRQRMLHKPSEMSGGEQQRVAIARALVTDPPILLGDEPSGNLDTKNTQVIVDLIKKLNKEAGKTVIVITHNLEVADESDRIIFIRDGKVEREKVAAPPMA